MQDTTRSGILHTLMWGALLLSSGCKELNRPPAPPSGEQRLADRYPCDRGIATDPAVIWAENFEEGSVSAKRSEEHTSELQSPCNLVCRLLLEKKKKILTHLRPHHDGLDGEYRVRRSEEAISQSGRRIPERGYERGCRGVQVDDSLVCEARCEY